MIGLAYFWCDPISSFPALAGNRAVQAVARPDVLIFPLSSSLVLSLPLLLLVSDREYQPDRLVPFRNGMIGSLWHPPWPACSAVRCFWRCFTDIHSWACLYACGGSSFMCQAQEGPGPSCAASNGSCLIKLSCLRTVISKVPSHSSPRPISQKLGKPKSQHTHTLQASSFYLSVSFFLTPSLPLLLSKVFLSLSQNVIVTLSASNTLIFFPGFKRAKQQ